MADQIVMNDMPLRAVQRFLEAGFIIPSQQGLMAGLDENLARLEAAGVCSTGDILRAAQAKNGLEILAERCGIPVEYLVQLHKLCRLYGFRPISLAELAADRPDVVGHLAKIGVKKTSDLLDKGHSARDRQALAEQAAVPVEDVTMVVHLADLTRIPGVKEAYARLYYDAGFESMRIIAASDAEHLRDQLNMFIALTGRDAKATTPKEAGFVVAFARILPPLVE